METLLLDPGAVRESARLSEVIQAVEEAFAAYATGDAQMPPKSYIDLPHYNGDFRSMPAYLNAGDWDAAGVKWVNSHPDNPDEHDLPTVMGTMIYSDPETAVPLALIDGTTLTRLRTGAAAAVATDHLAREDARSLGIVGAGVQSHSQTEAISKVRDVDQIIISDLDEDAVATFHDVFGDRFDVREGSIAEAAACDILCTTTPVEEPIVAREAVGEHTHINAMGADAAGKHELADDLLADAKVIVDDLDQASHSGEINVPWANGLLDADDVHAELGEVVIGRKEGRTPDDRITVFDSTGLAIQDIAAAHVVYENARERGLGTSFPLVDTSLR